MIDYATCQTIDETASTPCFLVDDVRYLTTLRAIRAAFEEAYGDVVVGASFKTNYLPYLCDLARRAGCYAEVVSFFEYRIALAVGYPPEEIIFNGPVKRYEELREALRGGSLVNLDGFYEIDHLRRLRDEEPELPLRVGLRLNIDLSDPEGDLAFYGDRVTGRFGFEASDAGIGAAVRQLRELGCEIVSLHGHSNVRGRAAAGYERIAEQLCAVRARYDLDIRYLNVGGGFFGPVPDGLFDTEVPTFADYAERVGRTLERDAWVREHRPRLVIEPGMSVLAGAMSYLTKVFEIKELHGHTFAQVDGNVLHVRPSRHRLRLPYRLHQRGRPQGAERTASFVGATCMEVDVLMEEIPIRNLQRGDYLQIENVGAYTFVMAPTFCQVLPSVARIGDDGVEVLRTAHDFDNFMEVFRW